MICPNCSTDLDGELIFETFYAEYGDELKAVEAASLYGATKTTGRWGRQLAIYGAEGDRTMAYRYPDCMHVWART